MRYPGFCGDSYVSQSRLASCSRTVNFYPEIVQVEVPKNKVVLYPTPGIRIVATSVIAGAGRGAYSRSGRAFIIIGDRLYEVHPVYPDPLARATRRRRGEIAPRDGEPTPTPFDNWTASLTSLGTVAVDVYPASMAGSNDVAHQLAIASGTQLYILDFLTNTLTGPYITGPQFVVYHNHRFVALDIGGSRLRFSDVDDGTTWDGTNVIPRSDAEDPWQSLAVSTTTNELWVLGEWTGSIYYDAGTSFPLQIRPGVLITPGIAAPFSLVEVNGAMMWLAHDRAGTGTVVRARGYNTEIVSTEAVNYAIRSYIRDATIRDAIAYTYEEQGHYFYVLNFPTAHATWVYDLATGWWHERGRYNGMTGTFDQWPPGFHMHEFSRHLMLDYQNGFLYDQSIDLFADADLALHRLRIAPGLVSEMRTVYYDTLRLYLERGVATRGFPHPPPPELPPVIGPQGTDPKIALRISNNGGKTWGSDWNRDTGRIGAFDPPYVEWHQLGSAEDRVFSVHVTDPIPWRIIDAYLDVRMGT